MLSDVTRIEWHKDAPVIVLEAGVAKSLVRLGYAGGVTDAQLDAYNKAVDEFNAANGTNVSAVPPVAASVSTEAAPPIIPQRPVPTPPVIEPAAPPVQTAPVVDSAPGSILDLLKAPPPKPIS